MIHQTAPNPHDRQPSPSVDGSITFTHLKENLSMVKLQDTRLFCERLERPVGGLIRIQISMICEKYERCSKVFKGPKREMFVARIFTKIRPVWVGDLETTVGQNI
jgi:hypothetical protein